MLFLMCEQLAQGMAPEAAVQAVRLGRLKARSENLVVVWLET